MNTLTHFLLENYIWFLVICLILIFALIGYLVDITTPNFNKNKKIQKLLKKTNYDEKVMTHPSLDVYTNEQFDEPLIDDNE